MKRKALSWLLSLCLIVGLLPTAALAAEQPWAQSAVTTLNGIYSSGVFSTDDAVITKGDAYTVLNKMGCTSDKVTENSTDNLTRSDACDVLAEVFDLPVEENSSAIQYLYDQNIINGVSSGNLDGNGTVSKAQFAVLTYRVLNAVGGGKGSSVDDLKPGTDEYFSWMYLAARKCVDFNSKSVSGNITCSEWHKWISTLKDSSITLDFDCACGEGCDSENCTCTSDTCGCPCCNGETTKLDAAVYLVKDVIEASSIFSDVPASSPYYDGVMYLFDHGIVSGQGDGTFAPNIELPRFQLAVLLAILDNADCASATGTDRITGSISYAINQGYMTGTAPQSWDFQNPDSTWSAIVTRQEAITAVMKQAQVNVDNVNVDVLERFSDKNNISEGNKPYVAYAVSIGLVNGGQDGALSPNGNVTRGVFGVLLYRTLLGVDETKMQDYAENVAYAKGAEASMAMFFALPDEDMDIMPLTNTETSLTLREDWRLTSDLDLAVSEGETLTINGGGHHIYEMGGKLTNSGLGVVKFSDGTCLYSAPSDTEGVTAETWGNAASDSVMLARQPHSITIGTFENGTVTATVTGSSIDPLQAKKGDTVSLTVTPAEGYELGTLTVTATEGSDNNTVTVTNNSFTMPASDVTIAATFQKRSYNGGGGGGTTTYTVTVDSTKNGTVTAEPASAGAGETVILTVTANEGYELDTLTVTDASGSKLTLTDNGNGTYTFTMPDGEVKVSASFKEAEHDCPSAKFTDVDTTQYYHEAVDWAVTNDVVAGTTATTFSPNASCTRAQAVSFLWRAAGSPAPTSTVNPFTDVKSGAYYYDAVLWAVEKNIVAGTTPTTFSPNATVTRAQVAAFLYRHASSPAVSGSNSFTDVPANAYYADAVQWAVDNKVAYGTSTTTFSPNSNCTRAQTVAFLYRDLAE